MRPRPFAGLLLLAAACAPVADAGSGPPAEVSKALSCETPAVDFGTGPVEFPRTRTLRCRNDGDGPWTLVAGAADGVVVAVDPIGPVAAGERWELTLSWTPREEGSWTSTLPLLVEGGAELAGLALRGKGVAHCLELLTIDGVDLGVVAPGREAGVDWDVTNACDEPLQVLELEVEGTAAAAFRFAPDAPFEVPAFAAGTPGFATLRVIFAAESGGPVGRIDAEVLLTTDDPSLPRISVDVAAFVGGPAIACSPTAIDLGATTVFSSRRATVICSNTGTAVPPPGDGRLVVEALRLEHPEFTAEVRGGLAPGGYEVGESFTLDVAYTPVDTGPDQTLLQLLTNASNATPDAPYAIALAGLGVVP